MNLEHIKELISLFEASSLTELALEEGDWKIRLTRQAQPAPLGTSPQTPSSSLEQAEKKEKNLISSPMVGTFYAAASPEAPALARVGDLIKAGQTIGIIEAMKLKNELTAEQDCQIEAILVGNEEKVDYGQPLFRIKPL